MAERGSWVSGPPRASRYPASRLCAGDCGAPRHVMDVERHGQVRGVDGPRVCESGTGSVDTGRDAG